MTMNKISNLGVFLFVAGEWTPDLPDGRHKATNKWHNQTWTKGPVWRCFNAGGGPGQFGWCDKYNFVPEDGVEVAPGKFTAIRLWDEDPTGGGFLYHTCSNNGRTPAIILPNRVEEGVYEGHIHDWGFIPTGEGTGDWRSPLRFAQS